jgi:hypothetical protein
MEEVVGAEVDWGRQKTRPVDVQTEILQGICVRRTRREEVFW